MAQPIAQDRPREELAVLGALALVFFAAHLGEALTPWIQGVDPFTRLYHIDRTVVVVHGDVWPPVYQLLCRLLHRVCDRAWAYKVTNLVLATVAMFLALAFVRRVTRFRVAVAFSLFFFLYGEWGFVATNPYMEPLFYALLAAGACLAQRGRWRPAIALFATAGLTRAEVSIAAPVVLVATYVATRSLRSVAWAALAVAPGLAWSLLGPALDHAVYWPKAASAGASIQLLGGLFDSFTTPSVHVVVALLAVGSTVAAILAWRTGEGRSLRAILWVLVPMVAFIALYAGVVPFFHDFAPAWQARRSLLPTMAVYFVAAAHLLHERPWPELATNRNLAAVVGAIAIAASFFGAPPPKKPAGYWLFQGTAAVFRGERAIAIDPPPPEDPNGPSDPAHRYYEQLTVYFRLAGWKLVPAPPSGAACVPRLAWWESFPLSACPLPFELARGIHACAMPCPGDGPRPPG
jgi:hypothetical protein